MSRIYTICLTDVAKDEAYKKTDSIKRTIIDVIKRDGYPNFSKNQILPVITAPNILRVIVFDDRIRLKAKIIPSTKPSEGVLFSFDDYDLFAGMKYVHGDTQGITFMNYEESRGYINFLDCRDSSAKHVITINKGAYYKLKFYID